MDKYFNINILGQELSVLSDSGDEHVERVVKYVKEKMREAGSTSANANTLNVAILAALNIADEYMKLKGMKDRYRIRVGNYRILFELRPNKEIIVFAILPRERAYE